MPKTGIKPVSLEIKNYSISIKTDSGDGNIKYIGYAEAGSLTSNSVWQIMKLDKTTDVDITWCDGNLKFDNEFDNRETLTYS